jgi:hypothetical protein
MPVEPGHGYATWLRWFWVLSPSCQRARRPSCYRRRRETASPPTRQPANPASAEMGTSADRQPWSQSQSQSQSVAVRLQTAHTQTRTWTVRSQHTVAVRLPLGPLIRIIRLIASHEWSCAERAAHPGQTKPGHDPGPARLVAALLRCCCVAGVPVSTRASVNVCPSMSHVTRPMSHIPPSHGRPCPCLTCLPRLAVQSPPGSAPSASRPAHRIAP